MIDGGDNDDEKSIVNYLNKEGVKEIEYIFATHPHADHIGGLDAVVDNIKVNKVFVANGDAETKTYKDFITSMSNKGLAPSVPLLNSEFELGSSKFKVVSVANEKETNNNSIVLLYTNGDDTVLLMGDAEKDIESRIDVGKVDILKVGHHGSHSSSTPGFIDKVTPKYAIIQVGGGNKYGHPHTETMDLFKSRDLEVHRNDECGDIIFKSSGDGVSTDCIKGSYTSPNGKNNGTASVPVKEVIKEDKLKDDVVTNDTAKGVVYWTSGGTKYHSDSNCSKMKSPTSGSIADSGRSACSKCN